MRLNVNYIAKGNAVHEIYAKAGVPFPAGLPSAGQEPETDFLKLATQDVLDAAGYLDYNPNPTVMNGVASFCLYSDFEIHTLTATLTVNESASTTEAFLCSEIIETGTEYDGNYTTELGVLEIPSEAGTYSYTLVVSADGQIYTITGTFTVEAENQQNNEQE